MRAFIDFVMCKKKGNKTESKLIDNTNIMRMVHQKNLQMDLKKLKTIMLVTRIKKDLHST